MVAERVTRTDDHRLLLTNTSESDEDRHKRDARPCRYHDELQSGHLGVANTPLADQMVTHFSSFRGIAEKRDDTAKEDR